MQLDFSLITHGSIQYQAECQLRHAVLRVPLGLSLYDENLDAEKDQLHFGLFDSHGALAACLIALWLTPTHIKLRQMAVHGSLQGQGIGRTLVFNVESHLAAQGAKKAVLHARVSVLGFYARLGYVAEGPEFVEVGLPHLKMTKELTLKLNSSGSG